MQSKIIIEGGHELKIQAGKFTIKINPYGFQFGLYVYQNDQPFLDLITNMDMREHPATHFTELEVEGAEAIEKWLREHSITIRLGKRRD